MKIKRLTITVKLATGVDLENVHIDNIREVVIPSVVLPLPAGYDGYTSVRFIRNWESDSTPYDIVGDRLETEAEATKRVEAKKRVIEKAAESKQKEIERLEQALAKLRRK